MNHFRTVSQHLQMQAGRRFASMALLLGLLTIFTLPARAHVGSKDVFEQVTSGPYSFFVTVRPPTVVPGVAVVEVRVSGPAPATLSMVPVPLTGEASRHPPAADALTRSPDDAQFFTGSVWLMASGSWQVRLHAEGPAGPADASVPVAAMALSVQRMQRPLGFALAGLGVVLILGMTGIVFAAVREARLAPGRLPTPARQYRAQLAAAVALVVLLLAVFAGNHWWNVEAASYAADVYHPLALHPALRGDVLTLRIDPSQPDERGRQRLSSDLLADHGHLMHLYAIRWPQMDAVYHLHPALTAPGTLRESLPSMPPGTYRLFADIVHRNGFPETLTSTLVVPPDASHNFLDSEDASAYPPPLSAGELGTHDRLPDGYTMVWDRPSTLTAGKPELFRFHLLDPAGNLASGMRPYLGMGGHAAFVKADGTVFAHTHPDGSAAMPAMMLANAGEGMANMADSASNADTGMGGVRADHPAVAPKPLSSTIVFPYGFPSAGRYRVFVQMKHNDTVETGTFDAEVH